MADYAPTETADRGTQQQTSRIPLLYQCLSSLSAILFLAAFLLCLDNYLFRQVRELAGVPGVSLWGDSLTKSPLMRHEVLAIEFHKTVVTAELLQAARDLPCLYNMEFTSCTLPPDIVPLLANFPALRFIRFTSCTIPQNDVALLKNFPRLDCAGFIDCDMDVGHFVSRCAASHTLQSVIWEGIPIHPGDFKELKHWGGLQYVSLRRSNIDADAIRDIAQAPSMERITLAETDITDDEIAAMVECDVFRMIDLSKTNVTESQIAQLCQCRKLEYLHLADTDLPASLIPVLEQSQSLKSVSVDGSSLDTKFYKKQLTNGCVLRGSGEMPM